MAAALFRPSEFLRKNSWLTLTGNLGKEILGNVAQSGQGDTSVQSTTDGEIPGDRYFLFLSVVLTLHQERLRGAAADEGTAESGSRGLAPLGHGSPFLQCTEDSVRTAREHIEIKEKLKSTF